MVRDLPNLSVHQLLYVREAARAPSWSEAARRLGVTQPALSQGVAEVERRLGVKLFDRRTRTRTPTPELTDVLAIAEQVIAGVDDLEHRLEELRTGRRGTVRIGMIDTVALGTHAPTISEFRSAHPGIELSIVVEPSTSLSERVAAGELDLAIVVSPNPVVDGLGRRLHSTPLFDEGIYVYPAVNASSELTRRSGNDVWGPWVTYPAGSQSRTLIAAALAARGLAMTVVAESSNPDVLRQMVRLGVGWCALPREVAEAGDNPLVALPGPPLAHRGIALIRRTDALANASADLLASAITQAKPTSGRRAIRRAATGRTT